MEQQETFELLFAEYRSQRQVLLNQLKELNQWYDQQYYLLVTSQNSPL